MLFANASQQILDMVTRVSNNATKQDLMAAIRHCKEAKPDGFDQDVAGARDRYNGNGAHLTRRRLVQRYPRTGNKIPTVTTNWLYMMACKELKHASLLQHAFSMQV